MSSKEKGELNFLNDLMRNKKRSNFISLEQKTSLKEVLEEEEKNCHNKSDKQIFKKVKMKILN